MVLKQLDNKDKSALFDFESRNKAWFEQFVPPRPVDYFHFESFSLIVDSLLQEQRNKTCFLYVIYDGDRIIGRANISDIEANSAEIGYRICQSSVGKGIATKAVSALIKISHSELALSKLRAKTTKDNLASQSVLEKSGFRLIQTIPNAGFLNNRSIEFVCYELRLATDKAMP